MTVSGWGRWRLAVPAAAGLAGVLFVASAVSSDGTDLRAGSADLPALVSERAGAVDELTRRVDDLQADVDRLSAAVDDETVRNLRRQVAAIEDVSGMTAVDGPGLVVTLDDAPVQRLSDDVDANVLVVHQQDIQAFVNALWRGGAVAVSLQGQRLVSTTAVKCVGNTVVIEQVPYAPPYVIEAVGDQESLLRAMDDTPGVGFFRDDAKTYGLGLDVSRSSRIDISAYEGRPAMDYARPL
ncbi:DUF881 domain-containing protein [soil metagenome]